jgi:hypothetical protein
MKSVSSAPAPLTVFISYSYEDEELKNKLLEHMAQLKRDGIIQPWQDYDIEAGVERNAEIKTKLETAEIILLLLSPNFLSSDNCYNLQLKRAVERHKAKTARVIAIILRPCDWNYKPFNELIVLPENAEPITLWSNQDAAFLNIIEGIRYIVDSLRLSKQQKLKKQVLQPLKRSFATLLTILGLVGCSMSAPFLLMILFNLRGAELIFFLLLLALFFGISFALYRAGQSLSRS